MVGREAQEEKKSECSRKVAEARGLVLYRLLFSVVKGMRDGHRAKNTAPLHDAK